MNRHIWAALTLGICLAPFARAEDLFFSRGGIAQNNTPPNLDPEPVTERPDSSQDAATPADSASMDRPASRTDNPGSDTDQVLELTPAEAAQLGIQNKRTDRKWKIVPFGRLKFTWDDNLFISNTNQKSDFSFTLTPGIAVGWGDYAAEIRQLGEFEHYFESLNLVTDEATHSYLFAKYSASASIFVENSGQDAVDHDALVAGNWETAKLKLGLRLRYQTLSGADIEVGDRVKRQVYTGSITSLYSLSDKTTLELNLLNSTYDYETQIDWSEWTLEDFLNYQILPKTKIALGTRLGTTFVQSASTQTFEQLVARVVYSASSKLALSLDGGVEWRQFGNEGDDQLFSVFNLAGTYAPFDGTQVSANGFRRNYASIALANENVTATGISARVSQRMLHRFYLTIEGGYQNSEYKAIASGSNVNRSDDIVFVKPSISFDVTKFLSAETAYQFQRNDSSIKENTFSENLVTLQVNFQF